MLGCSPYADVAQLVEHHLAKVRVAGSNPVVRSAKTPFSEGVFSSLACGFSFRGVLMVLPVHPRLCRAVAA